MSDEARDLEIVTSRDRLTAYYASALLVVGLVAFTSLMVQGRSIENGRGMAAVINLSGRQRMLSQRIAGLALQYRAGDLTARDGLVKATDEIERAHEQLSKAYIADNGSGSAAENLHRLYFVGPHSLDREMRAYILDARLVSALLPGDPTVPALLSELSAEARSPLLSGLDEVVHIHQDDAERALERLRGLQWVLLGLMLATLTLEALLIFRPLVRRIVNLSTRLQQQATLDQLTGVANRRGFAERAAAEVSRFQRYGRPISVIVADLDHFKRVNDTFGHEAGDLVLKEVGRALRSQVRLLDCVGRLGGEEFAVLLPETGMEDSVELAERLRLSIADLSVEYRSHRIRVTASFGVAMLRPDSSGFDPVLNVADTLLYLAKKCGRNCVIGEDGVEHREMLERNRRETVAGLGDRVEALVS